MPCTTGDSGCNLPCTASRPPTRPDPQLPEAACVQRLACSVRTHRHALLALIVPPMPHATHMHHYSRLIVTHAPSTCMHTAASHSGLWIHIRMWSNTVAAPRARRHTVAAPSQPRDSSATGSVHLWASQQAHPVPRNPADLRARRGVPPHGRTAWTFGTRQAT
jgi:hypothetical protein